MTSYKERVKEAQERNPDIRRWIISTPGICSGWPRLNGTRLRVKDIVNTVMNGEERTIYQDYPQITQEEVDACIIYNKRNEEIKRLIS